MLPLVTSPKIGLPPPPMQTCDMRSGNAQVRKPRQKATRISNPLPLFPRTRKREAALQKRQFLSLPFFSLQERSFCANAINSLTPCRFFPSIFFCIRGFRLQYGQGLVPLPGIQGPGQIGSGVGLARLFCPCVKVCVCVCEGVCV